MCLPPMQRVACKHQPMYICMLFVVVVYLRLILAVLEPLWHAASEHLSIWHKQAQYDAPTAIATGVASSVCVVVVVTIL